MGEIAGASGHLSQGPLSAHFGLGSQTVVDSVRVTWPSSMVDVLLDVACDQSIDIEEGSTGASASVPIAEPVVSLRLYPAVPNPFKRTTLFRYDLPNAAPVSLRVFDVSGRLVRTLADHEPTGPGRHTAVWDGRNALGQDTSSGIYFAVLRAGPQVDRMRMLMLK